MESNLRFSGERASVALSKLLLYVRSKGCLPNSIHLSTYVSEGFDLFTPYFVHTVHTRLTYCRYLRSKKVEG